MSTPDFILNDNYDYRIDMFDSIKLPKGIFVRPIKFSYVPKHITDRKTYTSFDKATDIYCYTSYGIIPIPKKYITRVAGSEALDINSYT